jgi:anti-sigma factor RsiW
MSPGTSHGSHHDHPGGGLTCRDLVGHLSSYLDGDLEPHLISEVEGHLKDCGDCRHCAAEIEATIRLIRERAFTPLSAGDRERLSDRLWEALRSGTEEG